VSWEIVVGIETHAQRGHAELGARFAFHEAPLHRVQDDVLAGELPARVRVARRVQRHERRTAAELADQLVRAARLLRRRSERQHRERDEPLHRGVCAGTRVCQSVACW
jgi:hypothetical protein